jgi:hypothetical protein
MRRTLEELPKGERCSCMRAPKLLLKHSICYLVIKLKPYVVSSPMKACGELLNFKLSLAVAVLQMGVFRRRELVCTEYIT